MVKETRDDGDVDVEADVRRARGMREVRVLCINYFTYKIGIFKPV
jgi:hypothetical protein